MRVLAGLAGVVLCGLVAAPLAGQVITFESGGLVYRTQTKGGLTVMYAHLASQVREYAIIQIAVQNGSTNTYTVRPEDIWYEQDGAGAIRAESPYVVTHNFLEKAGRDDVVKLVSAYEMGLYGMNKYSSSNGYEQRRQAALAEVDSKKLKAAAAASAIAFVTAKLKPGESTDGAVFFVTAGKPLGRGRFIVNVTPLSFEFDSDDAPFLPGLKRRE